MAENLDDGEFWLPPQFLTDDEFYETNNNRYKLTPSRNDDVFDAVSRGLFPYLGSPVESVVCSSETESDEEERIGELTRQMAHSTLELDFNNPRSFVTEKPKGTFMSGSPQSTLHAFGSSGKRSSPNGSVCQMNSERETWDLLRAAAGEVERMRLNEERFGYVHNNTMKPPHVLTKANTGVGFYTQQGQSLSHQQLQIAKFHMLRQQQLAKQQQGSMWGCGLQRRSNQMVPNRGRNNDMGNSMGLSSSAWPPLQNAKQQYGSGMRAVFLENLSGKKERTGTGVFLPRSVDSPAESRKKPACSTVLVPDRVAHALNLKLECMVGSPTQHHQPRFNGTSIMKNAPRVRSGYDFSQQKHNLKPQQPVNHEIRLPQEWTY